jgi:L-threonylcarbamoyladenylate synthase
MGLGVVYDDEFAYNRLNIIKRRPEDKPYALMVQSPDQISMFAKLNDESKKIINAFLPGPLTILVNARKDVPVWVTHGTGVIGIRVTSDPTTSLLLTYVGKPLLAPSANHSGEKPCMTSKEVQDIFDDELDYIVEGEALGGLPSTIVDLTGETYKIVRQGPITKEMIDEVLKGK